MRRFCTIKAPTTEELDDKINAFLDEYFIVNVDAHCYDGVWCAFILYEVQA